MLDRIRNRRLHEENQGQVEPKESEAPKDEAPKQAKEPKSQVLNVVGTREDAKLRKRARPTISETAFVKNEFVKPQIVFNEFDGDAIEIRDRLAVPVFTATNKTKFTKWDTELWLESGPKTWNELVAFADEAGAEMGDRGKQGGSVRQVLRALQNTIDDKKQKMHVLVGETRGKSMMLRLLAEHYKFELISVQEDDNVEEFLKNASAQGLDDSKRLWVLEHLDLLNFDKIMKLVPRLLKSGPVFGTSWPEADFLINPTNILVSHVSSWSDDSKLLYLKKFGPPIDMEPFFRESGSISGALNLAQLGRIPLRTSSSCGLDCHDQCSSCQKKRRIPSNLRLLAEDTVCDRSTATKCSLLLGDIDTSLSLLHEMAPMAASDIESVCRAHEAFSFLDLVGFSTIIKEAFIEGGTLQSAFSTKRAFDSGTLIPVPSMFWKINKKRTDVRTLLQKYRGIKKDEDQEYDVDDPAVDLRDLDEDLPLFSQARGFKDTWKGR